MTGYSYQPQTEFNIKDKRRDSHQRYTSFPMPDLPEPFERVSDCHFCLSRDGITATLWYDRQCQKWIVRFDCSDIEDLQFDRDEPAMNMRRIITEEIDRIQPDWIPV